MSNLFDLSVVIELVVGACNTLYIFRRTGDVVLFITLTASDPNYKAEIVEEVVMIKFSLMVLIQN